MATAKKMQNETVTPVTALAKRETSAVSLPADLEEQVRVLQQAICPGVEGKHFDYFIAQCRARGLNPILRQIYAWPDKKKGVVIHVAIDGMRAIAQRTGEYRGQEPTMWCGKDGVWRDVWLGPKKDVMAAKVGVRRRDHDVATWRTATRESMARGTTPWVEMPDIMLAKCAESQALRAIFPDELSGLYTFEEMGQTEPAPMPQQVFDEHPAANDGPPHAQREPALATMQRHIAGARTVADLEQVGETIKQHVKQLDEAGLKLLKQCYKARLTVLDGGAKKGADGLRARIDARGPDHDPQTGEVRDSPFGDDIPMPTPEELGYEADEVEAGVRG